VDIDLANSNPTWLSGDYDSIRWVIRPGAKLIVGVGPDQEVVTVLPGPFVLDPKTATATFRVQVTREHGHDFLITNTLLGNPGPQERFNPRDPAFSAIVRYLSVIH
jgi:hypothetical protein